jgi:hypothetical protein
MSERILKKVGCGEASMKRPKTVEIDTDKLSGSRLGDPRFPKFLASRPTTSESSPDSPAGLSSERFLPSGDQASSVDYTAKMKTLTPFDNSMYGSCMSRSSSHLRS